MLTKFITAITSLSLVAILAFLVTHREIYITTKDKLGTLYTSFVYTADSRHLAVYTASSSPELSHELSTIHQELSSTAASTSTVLIEASQSHASSGNKNNTSPIYETLNKGVSDTDETYAPRISPCKLAVGYKIGTFDTRFGISKESFIKKIDQASSLWEEASGRRLFYYDEKGSLTINLIYDERQAQTEEINNLALEINNSKQVAEQIRKAHEEEKNNYEEDMNNLSKDSLAFNDRYKAYSLRVDTYNTQGGAPKAEYDAMTLELEQLRQEAKNLEERRDELLITMDSINKKVVRYNELVKYINTLIKKSNSLGAAKFTEGRFVPSKNTVDIYQYNDNNKFLRVLTHELGHVLGINHNENPISIMYSINTSTTTTLSDDDKEDLSKVCSSQ